MIRPEVNAQPIQPPSLLLRMAAYMADSLFYLAIFCLIYAAFYMLTERLEIPNPLPLVAVLLLAWLADHAWLLKARGITLTKHIFGYRIVRDGGGPLRWRDMGIRALVLGILEHFSAGLASFILGYATRRRRTLHDWASGTRALRADAPPRWRRVAYALAIVAGLWMGLSLVWLPVYSTFVLPVKAADRKEGRASAPVRVGLDYQGGLEKGVRLGIQEAGFQTLQDTLKDGVRKTRFARGADSLVLWVTRQSLGGDLEEPWATKVLEWCLDTDRLDDFHRVMDSEIRPSLNFLNPAGNARRMCLEIHRAALEIRYADTRPDRTWYLRNRIVRLHAPIMENGWVPVEDIDNGTKVRTEYLLKGETSGLPEVILRDLRGGKLD